MNQGKGYALLIDDDSKRLATLQQAVIDQGFTPIPATSYNEARTRLAFQEFQFVAINIAIGHRKGLPLARDLSHPTIPGAKSPRILIMLPEGDPGLVQKIQESGCATHILCFPTGRKEIEAALSACFPPAPPPIHYDVAIINTFLAATIKAIEGNTQAAPKNTTPFVRREHRALEDFTGLIRFRNNNWKGGVALSLSRSCVEGMMRILFQEPTLQPDEHQMADFAGEMCNQLAGRAQQTFESQGTRLELSTAELILGKGAPVFREFSNPSLVIPFQWQEYPVYTQFVLTQHLTNT